MRRVRLLISGKVQGVSFRSFVKRNAILLNLSGFVRNLNNGELEILAEGEDKYITSLIELCKNGPESAIVKDIEVKDEEYKSEFKEFSVIR